MTLAMWCQGSEFEGRAPQLGPSGGPALRLRWRGVGTKTVSFRGPDAVPDRLDRRPKASVRP